MARIAVNVLRAGKLNYSNGLKLQKLLADQHFDHLKEQKTTTANTFNDKPFNSTLNTLIITEHNPVYTIGIRTKNYTLNEQEKLIKLGAEFHHTNRGGLITFHGPGQMVCYPIINLKQFQPSIKWYCNQIEQTIIDLCQRYYQLNAVTSPDTGVWISDRKICAIGLHASRYITTHGLAFNCNTDLKWFQHIVPCGIEGKTVTSLTEELMMDQSIDQVIPKFIDCFQAGFKCDCIELTNAQRDKYLNLL